MYYTIIEYAILTSSMLSYNQVPVYYIKIKYNRVPKRLSLSTNLSAVLSPVADPHCSSLPRLRTTYQVVFIAVVVDIISKLPYIEISKYRNIELSIYRIECVLHD